jgi:antitoxin YefM
MEAKSYSSVRKELAKTMDKVCEDHNPLIITRRNAKSVVMMSLEDYNSIEETAYLLKNPVNAAHLRESIAQAEHGEFVKKNIIDLEKKKITHEFVMDNKWLGRLYLLAR